LLEMDARKWNGARHSARKSSALTSCLFLGIFKPAKLT
jgi:hypothetical protein